MNKIDKIKDLISDKGVTKAKVAEHCKVNYYDFSRFLGGKPNQIKDSNVDKIIYYLEQVNTNDISLPE